MKHLIERKMEMIAFGEEGKGPITKHDEYPPCFEGRRQYEEWLEACSDPDGSPPPPRKDWPAEPNYCRDCNRPFQMQMVSRGRCLFPGTRFETIGEGDDEETVGISR